MSYSQDELFKNREHIVWEIGYCGRATRYISYLSIVTLALGIISDLLNMKLGLGATSWLLFAVVAGVMSLAPHLHVITVRHLLGMEVIKRDQS